MHNVQNVFVARHFDPESDALFWKVMARIRRDMRPGRPRNKALDYFRFRMIYGLMNPAEVIPGGMFPLRKTEAVERVAELESRIFGGNADTRSIWRSYRRVERFVKQVMRRLKAS